VRVAVVGEDLVHDQLVGAGGGWPHAGGVLEELADRDAVGVEDLEERCQRSGSAATSSLRQRRQGTRMTSSTWTTGARQSRVPSEASYGWSSTAATTGVVQSRETIPSRAIIIGRAHGLANVIVNKPGPMSRAGQD
jgi:hypothetical protein